MEEAKKLVKVIDRFLSIKAKRNELSEIDIEWLSAQVANAAPEAIAELNKPNIESQTDTK